jgi:hypothetical protein
MKKITMLLIALLCFNSCAKKNETTNSIKKKLRHVVLFKFKKEATPKAIKNIENAFIALPSKIETITDFEWGLNNSPESLNKGLTHCFFVTFDSEEGRQTYLPHPAHKAFVALLGLQLDDVLVLDYWAK